MEYTENGLPTSIFGTTYEWIVATGQDSDAYQEIYPATTLKRTLPKTLGQVIHWKFVERQYVTFPPAFVAAIEDGRVWGDEGTVITSDGSLLADLVVAYHRRPCEHPIFTQHRLPPPTIVQGTAVLLASRGSRYTYSHWLLDVLPRLLLFRSSLFSHQHIDYYIVSSSQFTFQRDTLHQFGIPLNQVIAVDRTPHLKASTLTIPSRTYPYSDIQYWTHEMLKQTFVSRWTPQTPERIFISRKATRHRHLLNEDEVMAFLERAGFIRVNLETMTVPEQANLFAEAKIIIAPHGSGLANLVFCSEGTKVIEFFSPRAINPCFWGLGDIAGVEYYYLLARGTHPPEGTDPFLILEDMSVDVDELAALMTLVGISY
jgi:capsular polysaccharide biosynthesis protein